VANLPPHVTLVHWFSYGEEFEKDLVTSLSNEKYLPIRAVTGPHIMLGHKHDISVTSIVKDRNIAGLHQQLYTTLKGLGVEFVEPGFVGAGYSPHTTHTKEHILDEGVEVTIDNIFFASSESLQGTPRRIIAKLL
jgi:hypothetical protein